MPGRLTNDQSKGGERVSDAILIRKLLSGDEPAMRELVNRYDRLIRYTIFKTAQRHCDRDPGWLDARANETWTGVVQSLRRAGPSNVPPQIPAYFTRIARNKSLDAALQADARAILPLNADKADSEPAEEALSPDLMLEGLEELERLQDCIARLSADEQIICGEIGVIMERRWKEAAARLGLAESTLRSKWDAILDKLKRCLEKKI